MRFLAILLLVAATQAYPIIEGEFFLGLKPEYDSGVFASRLKRDFNLQLIKVWDIGRTKIMWVSGEEADALRAEKLPEIKYMSYNGIATVDQCAVTAHPNVWGLDRIDQREQLPYQGTISFPDAVYDHGLYNGEGINVYVTDTGIDVAHYTFEGRATFGYVAEGVNGEWDQNGHGTHCAGTIAGREFGVAKSASPIAVKVLSDSGSGPWSASIDGLTWIQTQHRNNPDPGKGTVVSMSLGGTGTQSALEDLITEMAVTDGISFSISAGNSDRDACGYTPARTPAANTIGASDVQDVTASFSNFGPCVDIYGPGVNVLSAQPGDDTAFFSGTSMSAPHVAGVIARYMSSFGTGIKPSAADVSEWLASTGTPDALTFQPGQEVGTVNLLVYADCSMASPKM